MKKKIVKLSLVTLLMTALTVVSIGTVTIENTIAAENGHEENIQLLIKAGYTKETAEALEESELLEIANILRENPDCVSVSTSSMEVDALEEIEEFCSHSDEELVEQGADIKLIEDTRSEIEEMYKMSSDELKKEYGMNDVMAELFKDAVESGQHILEEEKDKLGDNMDYDVKASGSISSSKMSFTQTVVNLSTKSKPKYSVTLSYAWKSVFVVDIFKDEIVAGWGGGLNASNPSGNAKYYNTDFFGVKFKDYKKTKNMSVEETIQAGLEFIFPQSVPNGPKELKDTYKTKNGYCVFAIYQTKRKGKESKLISRYCHRTLSASGAGISISASGPSVSLNIGGAWDKTSQKSYTIAY